MRETAEQERLGRAAADVTGLLEDAGADLTRVFAWLDGEAAPAGPLALVCRARARVAAVAAYLRAVDEVPPPDGEADATVPHLARGVSAPGREKAA